jgi:hypothetical protein
MEYRVVSCFIFTIMKNLFDVEKTHFPWQKNPVYKKREFTILLSIFTNPITYIIILVLFSEFAVPFCISWVNDEYFGCKIKIITINPLGKDITEYSKCPKYLP